MVGAGIRPSLMRIQEIGRESFTRPRLRMGARRTDGTGRPQAAPRWESLLEGHRGGLITVAIVVAVVLLVGLGAWPAVRDTAEASDFRVQLYRGADVLGSSEVSFADVLAQSKPVILNFWGGSCPPCRFEMPAL